MDLSKYSLFIFDWDNTLVTAPFITNFIRYFKPRYWKKPSEIPVKPSRISYASMEGMEEESKLFSAVYDFYILFAKPKLKAEAKPLLKLLKERHKKVAIFSDGITARIFKEIHLLGLEDFVDFALGANAIGRYKPDPAGLWYVLYRFKKSRKEAVYIGDMAIDVVTARLAGIASCAIAGGLSSREAIESERPTYLFNNLSELLKALQ